MKEFFKKLFTKENMKKFFFSFVWLIVLVFVIDIVTKWSFVKYFGGQPPLDSEQIQIIPNFLHISLKFNQGMAWSLLSGDKGQIALACVSVVLGGGLIFYYVKNYSKIKTPVKIALALMIAGAIGNLIDRAFYWNGITGNPSGVIDWIQVYLGKLGPFPTFNIADSALVIGVIILLIVVIIESIQEARKDAKDGKYKYSPNELKEAEKAKDEDNQSK